MPRPRGAAMLVAGVMSGTSADGIDVALVRIRGRGWRRRLTLLRFDTFPYRAEERERILAACNAPAISVAEISRLNFWLGWKFGDAVVTTCRRAGVALSALDLVASHGQTVYHQGVPERYLGRRLATTLQLGEPAWIAERTGVTTIADFRVGDVAAGGSGAPLVPLLDYLLLRDPRENRIALNIGGIANLTLIPGRAPAESVLAFDTGPGNMVIDALAAEASSGRQGFDRGGVMAARGEVLSEVLEELLADRFYRRPPPKTAGREQFGSDFVKRLLGRTAQARPEDRVATATALTVETIARAIEFGTGRLGRRDQIWTVVASGGGVHNRTLMRWLRERLPKMPVATSDALGVPGDAKEAIAFAVLGHATWLGEPGNLIGATGARHAVVLGKIVGGRGRKP